MIKHGDDPEIEAEVLAHLARIYHEGLRNYKKAKKYYLESFRVLETLKPKTFTEQKWHQKLEKHMDEISCMKVMDSDNINIGAENAEEKEDVFVLESYWRETCKTEFEKLYEIKAKGPVEFLRLLEADYSPY